MPDDKQAGLLRDILDSAQSIEGYLAGVSREAFLSNPEKQDAVLRRLEIIGEAASANGFDYFNTKTGDLESGGAGNIAMWLLDPDYDGRALFPQQVFFPMAGDKEGWTRLSKDLKAQLDEEKLEAFRGTMSLPFEPGQHRRVAVKVIDDRGIESLKVINLE